MGELDHAIGLPPLELGQEVDKAERAVVRVRDDLIAKLRGDAEQPDATRWRAALSHANTALSLIVGVEYPVEGVKREPLKQAREQVQSALDALK